MKITKKTLELQNKRLIRLLEESLERQPCFCELIASIQKVLNNKHKNYCWSCRVTKELEK